MPRKRKYTSNQLRALDAAAIEPLREFRRGFAPTAAGPFFLRKTIRRLVATGALQQFRPYGSHDNLRLIAKAH
jgi:hypothetical protein